MIERSFNFSLSTGMNSSSQADWVEGGAECNNSSYLTSGELIRNSLILPPYSRFYYLLPYSLAD